VNNFDLNTLLTDISSDAPCGEDISFDADFLELERLIEGKAETQVGEHVQEAVEPDWKKVRQLSLELLKRSLDLRLIIYLSAAMLRLEGISGFRSGLALLKGLVEQYWDHLFPQLDPEDGNDPLERMNIIGSLSPPITVMNDPMEFIPRLMAVPLCEPDDPRLPHVSLRHMLIQSGEISSSETVAGHAPSLPLIDAAFEQTDSGRLKNIDQSIGECLEHLNALDQALVSNVGTSVAPSFSRLDHVLKQMRSKTAMYLERRGYGTSDDTLPKLSDATAQNDFDENGSKIKGPPLNTENQSKKDNGARGCQLSGSITSSREVLKALDMIVAYYAQNEPSSPIPLLIKRARRLVGKSFVDIIRDLSPDAMSQVKMVSGDEDQPED